MNLFAVGSTVSETQLTAKVSRRVNLFYWGNTVSVMWVFTVKSLLSNLDTSTF